jgi:hypothetical protein
MATLAPPIIFSAGLWVASQNSFWSSDVATYQAAVMPTHAGRAAGCLDGRSPDLRVSGSCTWNTEATGPPLYLVGDSNAEHFSESAILAGRQLGRPVVIATASACPFVSLEIRAINATPARNQQCTDYRAATLNYLLTATPGLIIISNIDSYWGSPVYAAGRDDASVTVDTQEKLAALREGLSDTVTRLQKAGHKVLLIQTVPQWKGDSAWAPDRCTFFSVLSRDCRQDMTVAAAESRQGSVRQVVKEVAVETGASELDTWPLLCDATKCSTETDGLIRYRDSSHITVMQSEALAEVFADAITSTR